MSTTVSPVLTGTWQLDPVHSGVDFEVAYLAGTFKGKFRELAAQLDVADEQARLEGTAKVSSVEVGDENLSAHLQSPDFFDAERHPELQFTAEGIDLGRGEVAARGEITIKGVTQPVDVTGSISSPIADPQGNDRIGLQLTAVVDRTAFGVNWNNPLPSGEPSLANEVRIITDLQFVKPA
jgi:polyisoprenoid-binding protein YceI